MHRCEKARVYHLTHSFSSFIRVITFRIIVVDKSLPVHWVVSENVLLSYCREENHDMYDI